MLRSDIARYYYTDAEDSDYEEVDLGVVSRMLEDALEDFVYNQWEEYESPVLRNFTKYFEASCFNTRSVSFCWILIEFWLSAHRRDGPEQQSFETKICCNICRFICVFLSDDAATWSVLVMPDIRNNFITDTTSAKTSFISVVRSKPYLPICGIITAGLSST